MAANFEPVPVYVSTPNEVLDKDSDVKSNSENDVDKTVSIPGPTIIASRPTDMDLINIEFINTDPSSWSEFIGKTKRDELILKGPLSLKALL